MSSQRTRFIPLGTYVHLTNSVGGGVYGGEIAGYRLDKVCLKKLQIYHKSGHLFVTPKWGEKRWFRLNKVSIVIPTTPILEVAHG